MSGNGDVVGDAPESCSPSIWNGGASTTTIVRNSCVGQPGDQQHFGRLHSTICGINNSTSIDRHSLDLFGPQRRRHHDAGTSVCTDGYRTATTHSAERRGRGQRQYPDAMVENGVAFTAWRGDGVQASAVDTAGLDVTSEQQRSTTMPIPNPARAGGIGVLITGTAGGRQLGHQLYDPGQRFEPTRTAMRWPPASSASTAPRPRLHRRQHRRHTAGTAAMTAPDRPTAAASSRCIERNGAAAAPSPTLSPSPTTRSATRPRPVDQGQLGPRPEPCQQLGHRGDGHRQHRQPDGGPQLVLRAPICWPAAPTSLRQRAPTISAFSGPRSTTIPGTSTGTTNAYAPIYFDQIFGTRRSTNSRAMSGPMAKTPTSKTT